MCNLYFIDAKNRYSYIESKKRYFYFQKYKIYKSIAAPLSLHYIVVERPSTVERLKKFHSSLYFSR